MVARGGHTGILQHLLSSSFIDINSKVTVTLSVFKHCSSLSVPNWHHRMGRMRFSEGSFSWKYVLML